MQLCVLIGCLPGDDVLLWSERHSVPSLGLAVVMPLCHAALIASCDLSLTKGAGQVDTLTKVGQQLPLEQRAVTEASLGASRVMEQGGVIGPADASVPVPATAGVPAALETRVVSHAAHGKVDLTDAIVRGDVELSPGSGHLHGSDGLLLNGALE